MQLPIKLLVLKTTCTFVSVCSHLNTQRLLFSATIWLYLVNDTRYANTLEHREEVTYDLPNRVIADDLECVLKVIYSV